MCLFIYLFICCLKIKCRPLVIEIDAYWRSNILLLTLIRRLSCALPSILATQGPPCHTRTSRRECAPATVHRASMPLPLFTRHDVCHEPYCICVACVTCWKLSRLCGCGVRGWSHDLFRELTNVITASGFVQRSGRFIQAAKKTRALGNSIHIYDVQVNEHSHTHIRIHSVLHTHS
jgi:hypothetical protein